MRNGLDGFNEWLSSVTGSDPFTEFAIIFLLAAFFGIIGQLLRQPLLIMFIALGIVIGPSVLNVIRSTEQVALLAEIGISILLFIVGLKLDLRVINSIGKIALFTGLGQVVFTSVAGYVIGLLLGFSTLHSLYIAIALTFSSTIIIVKLLTDKREIDTLHGRISIGFLIVQDIVVILMMIVLSAMGREGEGSLATDVAITIGKGALFTFFIILMMRWVMDPFSMFLARSTELLLLFSVAWALALAAFSHAMGFSSEVGAFLAGVSLASTPYREAISGRLIGLRDFLLLFFFIDLGSGLDLSTLGEQVVPALVFSFFVLVGNPLIVLIIMGAMGYRKRTAFLAGLTVAQISEFSLLFAALGYKVGHINEEIVGLITLVGLITIGISTYLILYSHWIYQRIEPALRIFERRRKHPGEARPKDPPPPPDAIILGMGRFGQAIARSLEMQGLRWFGVDLDPFQVKELQYEGKSVVFGDLEDPELLEHLPLQHVGFVYNTIPEVDLSIRLMKDLRARHYKGRILLTVRHHHDKKALDDFAEAEVVVPYEIAGLNVVEARR
jgi:Kef-type K+ transport system membrane component KefB